MQKILKTYSTTPLMQITILSSSPSNSHIMAKCHFIDGASRSTRVSQEPHCDDDYQLIKFLLIVRLLSP